MLRKITLNLRSGISFATQRWYSKLPSVDDVKDPLKILKHGIVDGRIDNILPCPRECDVLIIGGSVVGSSAAYFIKEQQNKLNVIVVEKDFSYCNSSALLSVGGMRQQFSCRENVEMSQFGFEFLRRANRLLAVDGEPPPDVQFNHAGYLLLADKNGADELLRNHDLQTRCGAINSLLSPEMLKAKFPWISTDGIEVACLGLQGEGWLDPAAYLSSLKGKNKSMGVPYVQGKVIGFEHTKIPTGNELPFHRLERTLVELPNGDVQPVTSAFVINAAGPYAGKVAEMAGIGNENIDSLCAVPLPVEPRKRFVYNFHCPDGPGLDSPLLVDTSQESTYFRREGLGNNYICGMSPPPHLEHDHTDLTVDYDFFDEHVWPKLAHRVPAFEGLKVKSAWAGYYDFNFVDQNLIIGRHPYFENFIFANGSSGHGLQHCAAMGRAISELINYQEYRTVELSALSFERFLKLEQESAEQRENNII